MKYRIKKELSGMYCAQLSFLGIFWVALFSANTGKKMIFQTEQKAEEELRDLVKRIKEAGIVKKFDEKDLL